MIIGGSDLFHAASQWALTVVSRMVDMVFYASVPSNNELVQQAKANFQGGMVIRREEIENYIEEADVVLIGPGMTRNESFEQPDGQKSEFIDFSTPLTAQEWNHDTQKITQYLLSKYPHKKWVVDAGALQMVDPQLLNKQCILTPHRKEFHTLYRKTVLTHSNKELDGSLSGEYDGESHSTGPDWGDNALWFEDSILEYMENYLALDQPQLTSFKSHYQQASKLLNSATLLTKGPVDFASQGTGEYPSSKFEAISGGNAGMTKGGTGDVLAGLVAGLYAFTNDPFAAAVIGSYVNKRAGDELYQTVGPFFNASDLADQIPEVMADVFRSRLGTPDSAV